MHPEPGQPADLVGALRTAQTALGALARVVDDPDSPPDPPVVVETADRDPDLEDEIQEGVRARRAPLLAIAATGAAGWAAHGAQLVADGDTHGSVVLGAAAASALALPVLRARFRHSIPDHWRRRWWLSGALACGWVTGAAAWGADSWTMTGVLVVGGAVLAAPWWAEWEVPHPREVFGDPEPERLWGPPREIEVSQAARVEAAFYDRAVQGRAAVAPGATRLTQRTDLPHGFRWLVELDPDGSVGTTEFLRMAAPLARFFGVRPTHVLLERLEGEADREDRAWMTVITRDTLGDVPYEGPRYLPGGVIPIGRYDGDGGDALWQAKNNTGPLNGVVIGGKGSGKSALLAALGIAYRASQEWFVVFGDADGSGNSSPLLRSVADDFAKGDEILTQLAALEAWYAVRGAMMGGLTDGPDGLPIPLTDPTRQDPVDKIMPCPDYLGLVWIIDEFHRAVKRHGQPFVDRFLAMVRIIRKYGGAVIVGTQAGLVDDFGDGTLRSLLLDNLVMMRGKNKSERNKVSDLGVSPSSLPMGGGYCFVDNGEGRPVMARTAHPEGMADWVPTLPRVQMDRRSALAYARHRRAAPFDPIAHHRKVQDALAAMDIALETGAPLPGEKAVAAPQEDPEGRTSSVGGVPIPRAPGRAESPAGGNVVPIRRDAAPSAPVSASHPVDSLPDKPARVLAWLRAHPGQQRARDIVEGAGLSGSDVSRAVVWLEERGLVVRGHGWADAAAAPSE